MQEPVGRHGGKVNAGGFEGRSCRGRVTMSGCGPGAASAKHRSPHDPSLADHREDDKDDASRAWARTIAPVRRSFQALIPNEARTTSRALAPTDSPDSSPRHDDTTAAPSSPLCGWKVTRRARAVSRGEPAGRQPSSTKSQVDDPSQEVDVPARAPVDVAYVLP